LAQKVGDKMAREISLNETDKATMEFESFNEGTLFAHRDTSSETIGRLLAIIGDEGEDISAALQKILLS
jgi:pyruvate dehydrogenase E2 component (dihydrolipoamide acetyltransferase)